MSLEDKIKELKEILELKGVSDSGREYRIYSFSSCHISDNKLQKCLEELFEMVKTD
jgi:hypothetical protein